MKKTIFIVLFLVSAITALFILPCEGYALYDLGVEKGDWVEYYVTEANNWDFFTEVKTGETLRFDIIGNEVHERMYPNGTVAFIVEDPICDVSLNGEIIQENVTLNEMLFYPKGEAHWSSLERIEEQWMEMAPVYGMDYSSNISIMGDRVVFISSFEGVMDAGFKAVVDVETGIAVTFERYLFTGEEWEFSLDLKATNVGGLIDPWYITYRYPILASIVGVIVVKLLYTSVFRKNA